MTPRIQTTSAFQTQPGLWLLCHWIASVYGWALPHLDEERAHQSEAAALRASQKHGLLAWLGHHVDRLNPAPSPETLQALRHALLINTQQALGATAELKAAMQALQSSGIRAVALKGLALSQVHYGHCGVRSMGDLDVLIRPGDASVAAKALIQAGYQLVEPASAAEAPDDLSYWVSYRKDALFLKPPPKPSRLLELHWAISDFRHVMNLADHDLDQCASVAVAGYSVPVLDAVTTARHLLLHGAASYWMKLKWMVDLAQHEATVLGPSGLSLGQIAARNGLSNIFWQWQNLAAQWLGRPIHPTDSEPTARGRRRLMELPQHYLTGHTNPIAPWKYPLYEAALKPDWRHWVAVSRSRLVRTPLLEASGLPPEWYGLAMFWQPFVIARQRLTAIIARKS